MVGTIEPRKGHAVVLDTFEKLWHEGYNYALLIIGNTWNMDDFIARLNDESITNGKLIYLQGASDHVVKYSYKHASALIQASAGEGFGLPIIEAAQYKLPVICNDIPVFHEVAGENALYFNREDPSALRSVLLNFVNMLDTSPELIPQSGRINVSDWQTEAEKILSMMKNSRDWYIKGSISR